MGLDVIPISEISILDVGWHYVALWLGCLIVGTALGFATHFLTSYVWATQIRQRWSQRKADRLKRDAWLKHHDHSAP